jgi:hypothetical protein
MFYPLTVELHIFEVASIVTPTKTNNMPKYEGRRREKKMKAAYIWQMINQVGTSFFF